MKAYRLITPIAIFFLVLSCTPREEQSPDNGGTGTASTAAGDAVAAREDQSAGGGTPTPGGSQDGEGDGDQTGEGQRQGKAAAGAGEGPPTAEALFIPVELLTAFPPEPRVASDYRIGQLPTVDSLGPQAAFVLEATERYVTALLAGEPEEGSYYDRYTEAEVEGRLRSNCDSFRLGVPERLPQGEWAIPYRCLRQANPTDLGGYFYLAAGDTARVVDGFAEPLGSDDLDLTPELPREDPPF